MGETQSALRASKARATGGALRVGASASFGEPMGPVWGGAKTHRTLSAHRCGATALCSKTHGGDGEEVGGVPPSTAVDHRPSAARPSGETGRPAASERRRVISVSLIRLYIRVPSVFAWRSCSSGRRNRAGNANRNLGPIKNEPQTAADEAALTLARRYNGNRLS